MIIFPIINFVLPLMLTCLVLVDDPPRCSECRKKMRMTVFEKETDELSQIANSSEFNVDYLIYKYSNK